MQNGGLIETSKLRHVLDLIEFGRIHLLYIVLGDEYALAGFCDLHLDLVAALALDTGGDKALRLVWHPHQLLLRPFRLGGWIVEAVPVDRQDTQLRIGPVYPRVHVRHLCLAQHDAAKVLLLRVCPLYVTDYTFSRPLYVRARAHRYPLLRSTNARATSATTRVSYSRTRHDRLEVELDDDDDDVRRRLSLPAVATMRDQRRVRDGGTNTTATIKYYTTTTAVTTTTTAATTDGLALRAFEKCCRTGDDRSHM